MRISYRLGADDEILEVGGDWSQFAGVNDAPELQPHRVIGRKLWQFIRGSEIKSVYRQILDSVRATQRAVSLPYRCDSPAARREMRLKVQPAPGRCVTLDSELVTESERSPLWVFGRRAPRKGTPVQVCSICRRVLAGEQWVEPEVAARCLGILEGDAAPPLEERACPDCSKIDESVRYVVTDFGEAPQGPRPLVVFLHGGGHHDYLLRLHAPPRIGASLATSFRLLSPIDRETRKWQGNGLDSILDDFQRANPEYARAPVHLTGISAGATAAWEWGRRRPDRFAAVAPIAGALTMYSPYPSVPVWAFHGGEDRLIPPALVERAFRELGKRADCRVSILEGCGHEAWGVAYRNPELWRWMLGQRPRAGGG